MTERSIFLDSPVGIIRISGNEKFISSILFTDESSVPGFETQGLPPHFKTCADQLQSYFKGTLKKFSFPFLQSGTDFQQGVWEKLESIAYGKTLSYAALARLTGDPGNSRAVGNANSKNKLAIVVPCHRVIGHDGKMTGYAGGIWRKEWLLQHEARFANGVLTIPFDEEKLNEDASFSGRLSRV